MFEARLFNDKDGRIVTADEVSSGLVSRHEEFVDVEEDFKVKFWKGAKNHGKPHFKIYMSKKDYDRLSPEKKSRYDIISEMRRYKEAKWHWAWKDNFKSFASIERRIKNENTRRYKIADAYYEDANLCIELQHSYIDLDFEERNTFYSNLRIGTVWLYDLTSSNVKEQDDGSYQILEDNSRGFFKISLKEENLKYNNVYIQTKNQLIYRVKELKRKEIDNELQSTIRYFYPDEIYTTTEFIEKIRNKSLPCLKTEETGTNNKSEYKTIAELWKENYYWMILENQNDKRQIIIHKDPYKKGQMQRDPKSYNKIVIQYVTFRTSDQKYITNSNEYYHVRWEDEGAPVWKLLRGFTDAY